MRLIDADKLIQELETDSLKMLAKYHEEDHDPYYGGVLSAIQEVIKTLRKKSNVYDVDKVVEQLKEVHEKFCNAVACGGKSACEDCEEYIMFRKNIQIVKAGGIDER